MILYEGDMANIPDEMPLHECTQYGKREQLEATVLLESYNLIAIIETWWDRSHDWSMAINGYRLFSRDRQKKRGGGVALYIKKWIEREELSLKHSHKQVESLWVRIRDRGNKGNLVVGVPIEGSLLTKPSSSSYKRLCSRRLSSYWGTSTTLTSAGKVVWRAVGSPGNSWSVLSITS